jgi:hypothetical protein
VQAAALVPPAQRTFVPYKARAFCTQQQRQQVAGKLFGLQLVLLLQELRVPPQQQEQVSRFTAQMWRRGRGLNDAAGVCIRCMWAAAAGAAGSLTAARAGEQQQ